MLKNKINITSILVILISSFSFDLSAQDLKKDITAINVAYKKATKMSLTMVLDMYETYTSNKLYFSQQVVIKKNGRNTFQSAPETESVNTPDYVIVKDDDEKLITYVPKKTIQDETDISFMMDIDSIKTFCKSFKFNKENDNLNSYDFIMQDYYPDYNRIKVFFNSKTFFVEKMVFFCEEDDISTHNDEEKYSRARVEISYKDINTKPVFKESDFTYQKYMVKQGNKFALIPALKNYELSVLSF